MSVRDNKFCMKRDNHCLGNGAQNQTKRLIIVKESR